MTARVERRVAGHEWKNLQKEKNMTWDFVLAGLIGFIDLNPLIDLVAVPLSWLLIFWR